MQHSHVFLGQNRRLSGYSKHVGLFETFVIVSPDPPRVHTQSSLLFISSMGKFGTHRFAVHVPSPSFQCPLNSNLTLLFETNF